jgi:fumarylacetoacetase
VIMRAWCERPGATRIGFGECRGMVLPPVDAGES